LLRLPHNTVQRHRNKSLYQNGNGRQSDGHRHHDAKEIFGHAAALVWQAFGRWGAPRTLRVHYVTISLFASLDGLAKVVPLAADGFFAAIPPFGRRLPQVLTTVFQIVRTLARLVLDVIARLRT